MGASEFIDYYEILEISPRANSETIERMFRYFAQRYHPDNPQTRDRSRFDVIVEAHNTLRDPVRRAQYDINFHVQSSARLKLADEVNSTKIWQDTDLQNKLLSVLYVKCRQNVHDPGVDHLELERLTRCPTEHLEFHLWYLREKGWVKRTESGRLAITVEGIDRVNSQHERKATNNLLSDQRV